MKDLITLIEKVSTVTKDQPYISINFWSSGGKQLYISNLDPYYLTFETQEELVALLEEHLFNRLTLFKKF